MPYMDGLKLMEIIGLEMDIPVIMIFSSDNKNRIMKGVNYGACDYLVKSVMLKELKNIWQHVISKNRLNSNDLNVAKSEANLIEKSKKGQKRYSTERGDESEDNSEEHYTSKKSKGPLVSAATRQVSRGHQKKFRSAIKKTDGDQSNMSSVSNGVKGYTSSTPLISFGGQGRNGLNFVNAFSGYPTPGMIPFNHHAQNPTTITNSFVYPNPLSVSIYPCHKIINQQLPRFHKGLDQNYRSGSIPGIGDVASNSLRTRNHFHQSQLNGSKYQSFTQRSRFMDDCADSSSNILGYNANNRANQSNSQLLDYIENRNIFGALPNFIGSQGPLFNNAISTNFSRGVLNDSVIGGQHNLFLVLNRIVKYMAHYNPFDNLQLSGNNSSSNASSKKKKGLSRGSKPLPNGKKRKIGVNSWGQRNQANPETNTYSSDIGFQVRTHLPNIYESFKDVPNDRIALVVVVKGLKECYDISHIAWFDLKEKIRDAWERYKCHLNTTLIVGNNPGDVKTSPASEFVPREDWVKFVDYCNSEKFLVILSTDNLPSQQATSSSQREQEKHQHIDKECRLVGCPWRIVAHGVIVGVNPTDMCHSVALGHDFYKVAIHDIVDASNMQMQDNYGASGYFLEIGGTNKIKHVETLKLTEVYASNKLESSRASQSLLTAIPPAQRECANAKSTEMIGFPSFAISVLNGADISASDTDNSSLIHMDVDQSFIPVPAPVKAAIFESFARKNMIESETDVKLGIQMFIKSKYGFRTIYYKLAFQVLFISHIFNWCSRMSLYFRQRLW
ncbi:hypothetical protein GIB67_023312 [Kingdonia uniflora]|uniref:Response regulatory domain-containing protein n=1 Tax=Kingdonia uniflora TaxID=39325 RepID=A0A7J7NEI4_9MAGN|nr:hypothetical protein GIB67_023312 [Kingdonia uniflora]